MNKRYLQIIDKPENLTYWFNSWGIYTMSEILSIKVERCNEFNNQFLFIIEIKNK